MRSTLYKTILIRFIALVGLLSLQQFTLAQDSTLTATASRTQITIEDTLQLSLRYSGKTGDRPDLSLLEQHFNVRNQSANSHTSIINGSVEAITEWIILLEPKREGKLLIPSFKIERAFSEAIEITVSAPAPLPAGTLRDIFIETLVDKSSAYVQEQVLVTYRLYFSVGVDSLDFEPLDLDGVVIESLPETIYQRKVSGKEYGVAEYSFALFAENSGQITIPKLNWRVGVKTSSNRRDIFGRAIGRSEVKRLRSDEKRLLIKAKPASFPANAEWLPASDLHISDTWSSETFSVGEPVTRNLTSVAKGLRAEQLPEFLGDAKASAGIKFYADQPQVVNDKTAEGFTAKRVESAAVVISQSGDFSIPALRIAWWDVVSDSLKYAEIPARTISVEDSQKTDSSPSSTTPPTTTEQTKPNDANAQNAPSSSETAEKIASLQRELFFTRALFVVSVLATLILAFLYFAKQRAARTHLYAPPSTDTSVNAPSTKALIKSCLHEQPLALRSSILAWAEQQWPDNNIKTLIDVGELAQSNELKQALLELDAVLYRAPNNGSQKDWDGKKLAESLKQALAAMSEKAKANDELTPLY